ncbi:MAG: DUF739 domain-containing protein [Oscillospiraceae bacterium]|nr:DUF739 domain-containing protein [Oscillospiraceae bacterium]
MDINRLRCEIIKNGATYEDVAKEIGVSTGTFKRKMKNKSFGIMEARVMVEMLNIKDPEEIFFKEELT